MCGVFGIYGHKDAARLAYLGLYSLQHRGEEGAGIAAYDGKSVRVHKGMGLVGDIFDKAVLKGLRGHLAIGHNRYSTTGASNVKNVQPLLVKHRKIPIAVSHNGNFTNTAQLYKRLERTGSVFQTTSDSEIVIHLLARTDIDDYKRSVIDALRQIEGAYSLVLMLGDCLVGARDSYGFRPLCLGKFDGAYILASETCALDLIGAKYIRDIEPGEIVFINKKGLRSIKPFAKTRRAYCIFEYIYFARPDSNIFTKSVYEARQNLGVQLAKEAPAKAELVTPIPDSGNHAALGYAKKSKIPFEMGMIRNHYIGRTFIQPSQFVRDFRVKVKLNPIREVLNGKRAIVVEDSIVRGTTSKSRIRTLRKAGAKKIHMRISCPPLKHPCFYGIDFPTKKELIASRHPIKAIKKFIGADSLRYLSLKGMLKSMPHPACDFCTACFNGDYPVNPSNRLYKNVLEK